MRLPINLNTQTNSSGFPILFTGDAIHQVSIENSFDLEEWKWHVESINGTQFCVITEKCIDLNFESTVSL